MGPPNDYGEDPSDLTDEEVRFALGSWLFWTSALVALALTVIGYGEATGSFNFFR
jgi:hypothetical protein